MSHSLKNITGLQNYDNKRWTLLVDIRVLDDYRITDYNAIVRIIYHSKFSVLHDYRITDYNAFLGGSWIDHYSILQNYKIRITRDEPCIWVLHDYRITDYNAIVSIIYHCRFQY